MTDREAIAAYDAQRHRQRQEFLFGRGWLQQELDAKLPCLAVALLLPQPRPASPSLHPGTKRWKEQQRALTLAAIKDGRIKRTPCRLCGTERREHRIQAHHWDYNKPLDVYFVCWRCHMTVHRVLAAVSRAWNDEMRAMPVSVYG